ncbi:hypothetical protein FRC11_007236, partial [Ceratobasidium sp. 423]
MSQPRTCGGGCCSPVAADKPNVPPTPPAAPVLVGGQCSSDDTKDAYCTAPEPHEHSTAMSNTSPPSKDTAKPSCGAPCCGGKAVNDEEVLSKLSAVVPVLPIRGSAMVSDSGGSSAPSSCQATICDDKCGHGYAVVDIGPKQEINDLSTPGRRQLTLSIQGMDCPGCSPRVVRALTSFSSVADCHVDVFAGRATITYHPDKANPDEMARHVAASTGFQCQVEDDQPVGKAMRRMRVQLGRPLNGDHPKLDGVNVLEGNPSGLIEIEYETDINPRDVLESFSSWDGVYVPPSRDSNVDSAQREVLRLLYLTVFSAILTLPVLVLAWAPLPPHPTAYGAVSLAMTTIIQIFVARPIYVSGIRALVFQYTIDMDLLVSLSIGTAYVFSTVAYACTVAGRPIQDGESYFETAALLVTLVMVGRLIAAYARRRSTDAVSKLGSIQPGEATLVERSNGQRSGKIQEAVVDAIGYAVAILVVSCPCALAICVPMVAVIAVAVGTRRGVLFKSVEALENACDVQVVVFDKTGTLTLGKLGVESSTYHCQDDISWASSEQGIRRLVRDLTASSTHPVAVAVHADLSALIKPTEPTLIKASDVESIPGKGLEYTLGGFIIRGGSAAWAAGDSVAPPGSNDHTVFVVSIAPVSARPTFTRIAYYTLSDTLRPDSLKTVRELTNRGLEVHILSGDAPGVVTRTAAALGIPSSQARGGCSPEDKAQWIKFLQTGGMSDGGECGTSDSDKCCSSTSASQPPHDREHNRAHDHKSTATRRKVMFIGDGTNDALALVQSDVSISMGSGTDIASSAANVVLLSSLSTGLSTVFTLARAARHRIWINFGWAFVYNVVAILLASGVLGRVRIPPQWAGLGEL